MKPHLALILRKHTKEFILPRLVFPEESRNPQTSLPAAYCLRETQEEIGVLQEDITVLKKLTKIYIPPSNFFVQPFIGICKKTPQFILQKSEVEALIEVKLSDFLEDSILLHKKAIHILRY